MPYRFKLRRDTAASWTTKNPVLLEGEPGVEVASTPGVPNLMKVGDGVTPWNDLAYTVSDQSVIQKINFGIDAVTGEPYYDDSVVPPADRVSYEVLNGEVILTDAAGATGKMLTKAQAQALFASLTAVPPLYQAYVVSTVLTGNAVVMPPESGYAYAIVDGAGHAAIMVANDGTVTIPKFTLPDGTVTAAKLAPDITAQLPVPMPPESGYATATVDQNGRIGFGLLLDGTPVGKFPSTAEPPSVGPNYVADTFVDGAGKTQIRSRRRTTGVAATLTTTPTNKSRPKALSDDNIVFLDDLGNPVGTPRAYYAAGSGGPVWPVLPDLRWACFGDSLTAGGWPAYLSGYLNMPCDNWGIGGQTSQQIAARQGGTPAVVNLAGGQIPAATTPVTVTSITPQIVRNTDTSAFVPGPGAHNSFPVSIAGVPGVLTVTTDGSDVTTFTRTTAGAVVNVPNGTPVITDQGVGARSRRLILWHGRNNIGSPPADTVAYMNAMLAYNKPLVKQWLTMTILPATDDGPAGLAQVAAASAALTAAFPDNIVDIAAYLRSDQAFTDVGVAKTAQDVTDINNGFTPVSLRGDALHLNANGYKAVAIRLDREIRARGWHL